MEETHVETFLAGFFGAVVVTASIFAGYEIGAMAAGAGADVLTLVLLTVAAIGGGIGVRKVGATRCCGGRCRLR